VSTTNEAVPSSLTIARELLAMFTVTDVDRRPCTSAASPFMVTVAALSKAIERATMPAGSFCDGSGGYRFVDRAGASCRVAAEALGPTFPSRGRPCVGRTSDWSAVTG